MHYFWINPNTAVRESTVHGLCRYATDNIKKDEIIFVAGGVAINTQETKWYKGLLIDKDYVLDLPAGSEYEAYVNHSCDPNVYIDGQIVFRALKDLEPMEFLNVDYGTFFLTKKDPINPCRCGAKNCRGKVTGEDYKFLNLPLSWYAQKRKITDNFK
jgi:SET domain-containing protein